MQRGPAPAAADRIEGALRHVGWMIRDGVGVEPKKRTSWLDIVGLFGLDVVAQALLQAGYQRDHGASGRLRWSQSRGEALVAVAVRQCEPAESGTPPSEGLLSGSAPPANGQGGSAMRA